MTESEIVYNMPTAQFRQSIQNWAGGIYTYLLDHFIVFVIIIASIVLIIIIRKISFFLLARRAKKKIPESTNTWFSWEEFEKWKQEKEKRDF